MNKPKFRPLGARVLIEKYVGETVSASGIALHIESKDNDAPVRGTILKKGSGVSEHLKVGDQIKFTKYAATEIVLESGTFYTVPEEDIIGIYE